MQSSEGQLRLEEAARMPADRLKRITALRRTCTPGQAAAVAEMLELRARATGRFTAPQNMLFTPQGLEQSTGSRAAAHRAGRFVAGSTVLDCCCGIGSDALALLNAGCRVIGADADPVTLHCAAHNCANTDSAFVCADVTQLDLPRMRRLGVDAAFIDPSRRKSRDSGGNSTRIRASEEYSPPLSFFAELASTFPFAAAKVSPAIDDDSLAPFAERANCRIEFVAERGECKEAVIWAGAAAPGPDLPVGYMATVLGQNGRSSLLYPDGGTEAADFALLPGGGVEPGMWLYEPQPSVVRAHLTAALGRSLGAEFVSTDSRYLAATELISTPFATAYQVLDCLPLHASAVQRRCAELGRNVMAIKTRWDTTEPEPLQKQIKGAPKGAGVPQCCVIVVTSAKRKFAIITQPAEPEAQ